MAATTLSPQMASGFPTRVQARNRVLNDHGIRVHEDLTDHESQDLLAFTHGRVGRSVSQPRQKPLEVLSKLQVALLIG